MLRGAWAGHLVNRQLGISLESLYLRRHLDMLELQGQLPGRIRVVGLSASFLQIGLWRMGAGCAGDPTPLPQPLAISCRALARNATTLSFNTPAPWGRFSPCSRF